MSRLAPLSPGSPAVRPWVQKSMIPRLLQPQALAFAAVAGTPLYQGFVNGDVVYLRFVLRKAA